MNNSKYNLGIEPAPGEMFAGIAYIIIPSDLERSLYIAECFRTSTVSIASEYNGYYNRVPIDQYSIQFVTFPPDTNSLGSAVSVMVDAVQKRPIITGIYLKTDEVCDLVENQFKFKKELNGNVAEISGSSESRHVALNVKADKEGKVLVNVQSADHSGQFRTEVEGETIIHSSTDTSIQQYGKFSSATANVNDESESSVFEQDSVSHSFWVKGHNIRTEKLNVNDGDQPFVLGKKWADFMKNFINEVAKSTVTTALGQMPLLNADQISQYHQQVDELLSTIAFIDK